MCNESILGSAIKNITKPFALNGKARENAAIINNNWRIVPEWRVAEGSEKLWAS